MFKVGDIVTGKDRSFRRSIYLCTEVLDHTVGYYKPVAFNGFRHSPHALALSYRRRHSEFRLATKIEQIAAETRSFESLCYLIYRLKQGKACEIDNNF